MRRKYEILIANGPTAAVLALLLLLSGCGLETYPYLAPVKDEDIREPLPAEQVFIFSNNTENDGTYFYGYEMYYKFYSTDAGSDFLTEEEALTAGISLPRALQLGFFRLADRSSPESKPAIFVNPADRGSPFEITVDFSAITSAAEYPVISYNAEVVEAARYVLRTGDSTRDFYTFYLDVIDETYEDITDAMMPTAPNDQIRLALIVFTYGKYDIYRDLYSETAAYLGSITVTAW